MSAIKDEAKNTILNAIVGAALRAEEEGIATLADHIREQGASIARRWNIHSVPGLPGTYHSNKEPR